VQASYQEFRSYLVATVESLESPQIFQTRGNPQVKVSQLLAQCLAAERKSEICLASELESPKTSGYHQSVRMAELVVDQNNLDKLGSSCALEPKVVCSNTDSDSGHGQTSDSSSSACASDSEDAIKVSDPFRVIGGQRHPAKLGSGRPELGKQFLSVEPIGDWPVCVHEIGLLYGSVRQIGTKSSLSVRVHSIELTLVSRVWPQMGRRAFVGRHL